MLTMRARRFMKNTRRKLEMANKERIRFNKSKNSSTRTHQSAISKRKKAVVNSPHPIYDQEPSMVDDDDEDTSKEKEIDCNAPLRKEDNGNVHPITKVVEGVETIIAPSTAEEKSQRRLEFKPIEKRFGRNAATKKSQRNLLKQQYENFTASSSKRNKPEVETLSLDDLYNNLKIYESEVKGTSSSNSNTHNIAFLSSNSTSSTNGAVNTAHRVSTASSQVNTVNSSSIDNLSDVVICAFLASQPSSPQLVNEDLEQIHLDDLEEMDLKWECRALRHWDNKQKEATRRNVPIETPASIALVSCDGLGGYDWSDQAEDGPTNFALTAYSSTSSNSEVSTDSNCSSSCLENIKILKEQNEQLLKDLRASKISVITYKTGLESVEERLLVYKKNEFVCEEDIKLLKREIYIKEIIDKCKTCLGYNVVPPPYTGNFMPLKPNLFGLEEFVDKPIVSEPTTKNPVVETSEAKASTDKSKPKVKKNTIKPSFAKIEFVKSKEQVKSLRKTTVKQGLVSLTTARPVNTAQPRKTVNSPRQMKNVFNKGHSTVKSPFYKKTAFANSNLTQKVNIVRSKTVNTARPKIVVNAVLENRVNDVKASACWVWKSKTKVIDHVSKHNSALITLKKFDYIDAQGNMSYLLDYKEIDGGYVSFGGNPKGGKITGSGTIELAEAVNTTCYVQNRVLVVKPHDKTPYELFNGRTPALGFMRPFGYHVTILNTKDHLGKFNGKVDEGFFVGYSFNSKAFRVFNSRTRIVKENLHISDHGKKVNEVPRQESKCKDQEKENNDNSINNVNIASTNRVSDVGANSNNYLSFDPEMLALEDISTFNFSSDHEDDDELANMNNLDTTIQVNHMDVKSVFHYKKIEEEVYVCQPLGFEDPDFPDKVYKVKKALYGLHQAPIAWYKTLSTYLLDNGFHKGKIDKTLFIKGYKDDILIVQVYVDDIIFEN
nr:copia protein [Tanacetum cinerariifolium]